MAEEAVKLGVQREDVLAENKSTNTLENVLFSLEVIDRELGLKNIKVITAVVKNYHSRRAMMTLRKHIPAHIKLRAAAYTSPHYNFTKDNWMESEIGRNRVLEEVNEIERV